MKNNKFKLSDLSWKKHHFDPNNVDDIKEYRYFLKKGKWKNNCSFHLEWPHLTINDMVQKKMLEAHIDNIIKAAGKKNERILS